MPNHAECNRVLDREAQNLMWISGEFPTTSLTQQEEPFVVGSRSLLEVIRSEYDLTTVGIFYAPFSILDLDLKGVFKPRGVARFVGLSSDAGFPVPWIKESMMMDLGASALPQTPGQLLAMFKRSRPYASLERTRQPSQLSQRAKMEIAISYRQPVPLSGIARRLGVSHPHLTRCFKQDFGMTPMRYRLRLRINDAVGLLSSGEDILDTVEEVGFNDTSRFYHQFRKLTGSSPAKCRR